MEQACVDAFLDDGWGLIGQLHRWLSKWPRAAYDRATLVELISQLQSLWAVEDDLGLTRLARSTLALEQILERFCSRTLEFNAERLADVTAAIEVFQDLLLGFEATREEPAFSRLDPIIRLERHARRPHRSDIVVSEIQSNEEPLESSATQIAKEETSESRIVIDSPLVPSAPMTFEPTIQPSVIAMLEQFVTKLDDTCHRLHVRMLTDETPYVTTTSRLEYLSQATRNLVEQIARAVQTTACILHEQPTEPSPYPLLANDIQPLLVARESPPALISPTDLPRLVDTTRETPRLPQPDLISMASAVIHQPDPELLNDPTRFYESPSGASAKPEQLGHPFATTIARDDLSAKSHRILILEESLFYRHFLSIALESAGYEPIAMETIQEGRAALESSSDLSAVLVSSKASTEFGSAIEESCLIQPLKVVLLTTSANTETDTCTVDERVSISHPQRLIAILDRLLDHPPHGNRRPA